VKLEGWYAIAIDSYGTKINMNTLQIFASQVGGYLMSLGVDDVSGGVWSGEEANMNLDRIVSPGTVRTYSIHFDHDNINNLHVTKIVTSGELKTSIQVASDLNWIDNDGVLNSLQQKLVNAEAAFVRGQTKTTINELNAFVNDVKAQKGKHIKEEAADILIDDAQTLINQIQ
jgi:hypothetical protein